MVSELDKRSLSIFMLLTLFLATFSNVAYGASLMVETDKESYMPEEHITISGSGDPGESVKIVVEDDDMIIFESTAVVTQGGIFTLTFLLAGTDPGEYSMSAVTGLDEAGVEFRILDGDSKLAHDLLELLSMSREKTLDMLELEEGGSVYLEGSHEKFLMAEEVAEEAYAMFDEGRYHEVAFAVTEALRLYSESIKLAENVEEQPEEEDFEEDVERVLELKDALERAYTYLEKVNATSVEFEEDGFNVSHVNSIIAEALRLLRSADESLEDGLVDTVEGLLSDANALLNEAMGLIQEINEFNKIEKAKKFLTETEDRLDLMEDRITNILGNIGVPELILNEVSSVFQNAKMGILEVKILLETGDFDQAMDEFEEVFDDAEDGLDIVEEFDGDKREILDDVEELEAKIKHLAEKIEVLMDSAVDVSEFISKFEHARSLLERAVHELEGGHVDVTEGLIVEAEDLVGLLEEELEIAHKSWAEAELAEKEDAELSEKEPDVEAWVEPEVDEEQKLELLNFIDKLEEELIHLMVRIDELGETGYSVSELWSKVELAKQMIQSAVDYIEKDELGPAHEWISELEGFLGHVEYLLNSVHEDAPDAETDHVDSVSGADEECDEEIVMMFSMELEELEGEITLMWDLVESLGEMGESLVPHLHIARELFAVLAELKPCDDVAVEKTNKLWDLLGNVEVFAKAILANMENAETPETDGEVVVVEEEPETAVWYYVLEMGEEVYGKFEWMVVNIFEEDSRIVFEEGQVYDCFLEWILSASEEVYEPLHGKIISVSWSDEEVVEWHFGGAVPFSWRGSELEEFTGEPHPMERLELSVSFVEET